MTRRQRTCAKVVRWAWFAHAAAVFEGSAPSGDCSRPSSSSSSSTRNSAAAVSSDSSSSCAYRHCRDCGQTDVFRR